ncbi:MULTISPECIES: hypothetical protein [Streptomyces]|uniref:hypothetical protein n=1 Tax=Streptomyces TaxID=1883 RepID=UPI000F7364D2|nr:hypothetical protein [Streptomyces sp. WAC05292]RSS84918.1 hypothetical protein EF903_22825 [Streptomyces sp. WAC05292]
MLAETVCSALAAAGLGIAAVTAFRRRYLTAARIAAYALVPAGLVLTGVVEWAAGIVFQPAVWVGFGLLGLSWLLLATTRAVERRGAGKARKAAEASGPQAVAPAAAAPQVGRGSRPQAAPGRAAAPEEDFSDIEAILKKHGI